MKCKHEKIEQDAQVHESEDVNEHEISEHSINLSKTLNAVASINGDLFEKHEDDCEQLDFQSNGFQYIVKWLGVIIYNSDNDERAFDEAKNEYEPIELFLRKECDKIVKKLTSNCFEKIEWHK